MLNEQIIVYRTIESSSTAKMNAIFRVFYVETFPFKRKLWSKQKKSIFINQMNVDGHIKASHKVELIAAFYYVSGKNWSQ